MPVWIAFNKCILHKWMHVFWQICQYFALILLAILRETFVAGLSVMRITQTKLGCFGYSCAPWTLPVKKSIYFKCIHWLHWLLKNIYVYLYISLPSVLSILNINQIICAKILKLFFSLKTLKKVYLFNSLLPSGKALLAYSFVVKIMTIEFFNNSN